MIILDKEGNVYNGINNQLIGDNVLIDGYELIISGIKNQHFCKNWLKEILFPSKNKREL